MLQHFARSKRVFHALALFLNLAPGIYFAPNAFGAAVPPPEKLLSDDTLLVVTAPDFAKLRETFKSSPQSQAWSDPALKPFRDHFMSKWNEEFVKPLERELDIHLDDYTSLPQGQVTFALTQPGARGKEGADLGILFLVDTKSKSGQLKNNLTNLRKKWADAGKTLRTEKIRDFEFSILSLSSNDVPSTLKGFFPQKTEVHELGEENDPKSSTKSELVIGQADSLLVVGNSTKAVEKVLVRLTGGSMPALSELAAYNANHQAFFRDAPIYGWLNLKAVIDLLTKSAAEKKESDAAPDPFGAPKMDKLLGALGLNGLRTAAFTVQTSAEGTMLQFFVGVSESSRQGLLKILTGEPKESSPPPFVPADAVKFQRWRLDGQKVWAALEKMLRDINPQWINSLNMALDMANANVKEKDPGFDVRKSLIGNLGDDIITYQKAAKAGAAPNSGASLFLLGSPKPEDLAAALKTVFTLFSPAAASPTEREFLGRKIFSMPAPSLPIPVMGAGKASGPRTLNYCASGGYVALSSDVSILEEFLRSSESQAKALRETPGLTDASQKVIGTGTGLFGYENQAETMRVLFEALRKGSATNLGGLNPLTGALGIASPDKNIKDWMDFSLLPPYERIAKYFYFTVYSGSSTVDGLTFKMFAPVPPGLRGK
jgi:hypothetical protein